MSQYIALFASLLALPLCAQQDVSRPSPFPDKNRERAAAAGAADKSESRSTRSARRARAKVPAASGSALPTTSGTKPKETGKASFFTSSAGGGLTASGGRLNAGELVAAHATYPLGSFVKVTNMANGKTVEVRIVDRFPVSSRIINVSEAAARQLDFIEAGTAEVHLELASQTPASLDHK